MLHFTLVLRACRNNVDARGVYAGMSEDVGKLGNVLFNSVEGPREQVS